jgi:hypothetical protein
MSHFHKTSKFHSHCRKNLICLKIYIVVNFVRDLAVFISIHRRMSFTFRVRSDETQGQSSLHRKRFNINSGTETRRGAIRSLANCSALWNKSWPLIPAVLSLRYIQLAQSIKPETFSLATSGRSWLRVGEIELAHLTDKSVWCRGRWSDVVC